MKLIIDSSNRKKYLEVKDSRIQGAGLGLFALQDIKKGTRIGQYYGEEISPEEYNRRENKRYMFEITHRPNPNQLSYIDGSDPRMSGYTRYINGAKTKKQKKLINSKFYQYKKKIFVSATRDIKAGTEIIIPYGDSYFLDE